MRQSFAVMCCGVFVLMGLSASTAEAALPGWAYGAGGKLTRGVVNIVTGWLELPNQIVDTTRQQNVYVGMSLGLLRGVAKGVMREAVGVYETVTFLFPAPANYAPILYPVYAFETPPPPPTQP